MPVIKRGASMFQLSHRKRLSRSCRAYTEWPQGPTPGNVSSNSAFYHRTKHLQHQKTGLGCKLICTALFTRKTALWGFWNSSLPSKVTGGMYRRSDLQSSGPWYCEQNVGAHLAACQQGFSPLHLSPRLNPRVPSHLPSHQPDLGHPCSEAHFTVQAPQPVAISGLMTQDRTVMTWPPHLPPQFLEEKMKSLCLNRRPEPHTWLHCTTGHKANIVCHRARPNKHHRINIVQTMLSK